MVYLLACGHFQGVAHVLREARIAVERGPGISPEHKERLERLGEQLSTAEALSQLIQALDDTPILPPQEELMELFDQLRPTALSALFLWLPKIRNSEVRTLLEAAAARLAPAHTAELVRLIQSSEHDLAAEGLRSAG